MYDGPEIVHPDILAYLMWKEGETFHKFDANSKDKAQPGPRSWTKLSYILHMQQHLSEHNLDRMARGIIGSDIFSEFMGFREIINELPMAADIIEDPSMAKLPERADACYAVICNLATHVAGIGDLISPKQVEHSIEYLERLPETFGVYGFRLCNDANPEFSQKTEAFARFSHSHTDLGL